MKEGTKGYGSLLCLPRKYQNMSSLEKICCSLDVEMEGTAFILMEMGFMLP